MILEVLAIITGKTIFEIPYISHSIWADNDKISHFNEMSRVCFVLYDLYT